jgi:hypothetical protein
MIFFEKNKQAAIVHHNRFQLLGFYAVLASLLSNPTTCWIVIRADWQRKLGSPMKAKVLRMAWSPNSSDCHRVWSAKVIPYLLAYEKISFHAVLAGQLVLQQH